MRRLHWHARTHSARSVGGWCADLEICRCAVVLQVRMGKGKGTLDYWAAPIRAGQIIFEFDRCSKATAMQAVQAIKAKMPIKIDFVEWN